MSDSGNPYLLSMKLEQGDIESRPVTYHLVGDEEYLPKLEKRFDLPEVGFFEAAVTVRRKGKTVHLGIKLEARFQQTCVISLEDFPVHLHDESELELVPGDEAERRDADENYLLSDLPEYDELPDGPIDLGEIVIQSFGLALDPHPRKPGVDLEKELALKAPGGAPIEANASPEKRENPFAALKDLAKNNKH